MDFISMQVNCFNRTTPRVSKGSPNSLGTDLRHTSDEEKDFASASRMSAQS